MRDYLRRSSIELLEPRSPADRRALFDLIRDAIRPTGAPLEAVRLLSLAAVRHLSGHGGRILLTGANTQAKKTLVRTLAAALDLPFAEVDAGSLAETNWRGADLAFFLGHLHTQLERRFSRESVPWIAERSCVFISHFESVRAPGAYSGSSTTRDYREGKQLSLYPLMSEGMIPVTRDFGGGFLWRSKLALVIVDAHFGGFASQLPDADDLVSWGLVPVLANALTAFTWIEVGPPDLLKVEAEIRREIQGVIHRFLAFGYHLRVAEQVLRYLVDLVGSGDGPEGVRAAAALLSESADRILSRMLDEGAEKGSVFVLARDDLFRPRSSSSTGLWRE